MNSNPSFKKKLIATAIGSYALAGLSGMAVAQTNDLLMEEVVVTGILGSLSRSMDIKRDAQGVVDAISAEDIGKFPDTNLAESLQRITGVSIDRSNGEGSRITVRGFGPDYSIVTLNGRQMATSAIQGTTAAATRSFDFANLASEGVSGVEVYKTSRASIPTGGIGATVNILTTRPFDNPGLTASAGVKAVMDQSTDSGASVTPEVSGLYSQTFADDTFGVAISASYQERESGSRVASTGAGWFTHPWWVDQTTPERTATAGIGLDGHDNRPGENTIYSVPQQIGYDFNEIQRTRVNSQLTLQYRPIDSVTTTFDYHYSLLEVAQQFSNISAWFNFGDSTGAWTDGPISTPTRYSEQHGTALADVAMGGGDYASANENHAFGLNVEWQVNDRLVLEFDVHNSTAESRPDSPWGSNNNFGTAVWLREQTNAHFGNHFPVMVLDYPDGVTAIDPEDIRVTGSAFNNSYMKSEIDQFQIKGNLEFDGGQSIDFGVSATEVKNRSAFANVQRDSWGGVGEAGDFPLDTWVRQTVADKFNSPGSNTPGVQNERYTFDMATVANRASVLYNDITTGNLLGDCGTYFCPSTDYASQTDRRTQEKMYSAFIQLNLETELAGMPVNLSTGMRYESTRVASQAAVPDYENIAWVSANEFSLISTDDQQFTNLKGGYDKLLPSLDFSIEVTPDVVVRASFSETIGRPNYADIQGGTTVSQLARIQNGDGGRGNPNLLPLESINLDLSVEWYYGFASYASVGVFRKDVRNFIGTSIVEEELFDLPNPGDGPRFREAQAAVGSDFNDIRNYIFANYGDTEYVDVGAQRIYGIPGEDDPMSFNVVIPVNDRDAAMYGLEAAIQHSFADTGFGVIANFTLVDGDVDYDDRSIGRQFALLGQSNSYNLIGFYDKDGLQARLAYNWRDKFLVSTQHGTGHQNPIYTEAYGQWDINVSYDITDELTVFAEGINITDEYSRQHSRRKEQIMNIVELGPRYNVGLRYTF